MEGDSGSSRTQLPFTTSVPSDPPRQRAARLARIIAYILLAIALIGPVVQFQHGTMRRAREAARLAALNPDQPARTLKKHKGAIGRWRKAVRALWAGQNIYARTDTLPQDPQRASSEPAEPPKGAQGVSLHPNMPFVVILLTPFAYLPLWAMALSFNVLKLAAILAAMWFACDLAGHRGRRIQDWVLGLGLLGVLPFIIGDIQHGNTNGFVLFAVVFHLWLYRRGREIASGAFLALAICLKMTPALFVLYWLYQRNWKVLASAIAALVLFAAVLPAAAIGPERHVELTRTWLDNLILPGLLKGAWYPIHINQSISGVFSRYFLAAPNPNGDIFWNPDDNAYALQEAHGWIALLSVSQGTVKWLIRLGQAVVVALIAWGTGWGKLPRDDGRRALHYGLVCCGMMLLNQRTWDHHAGVLLAAHVAVWQAIGFGALSRGRRLAAFALMITGWALVWLSSSGLCKLLAAALGRGRDVGEHWGDLVGAYGPEFYCFVLLLVAGVICSTALGKSADPYCPARRKLLSRTN